MGILSRLLRPRRPVPRSAPRACPSVEILDERQLLSAGLAYVGLARAAPAEMSNLAGLLKPYAGEVEVSFLPFEFNPSNPFGNATRLAKETLPNLKGKLRLTVDLEWFVHSEGVNGLLNDGASAALYGAPAQRAFWNAWENYNPALPLSRQPAPVAKFLDRVHQADVWVAQLRSWAASRGLQNKLGVTFVPVLEDEYATEKGYTKLVGALQARQAADGIAPTPLRRSVNGDHSPYFRISNVPLEFHGSWSRVSTLVQKGDTWSNDGTAYSSMSTFVSDERAARARGVSVLYWNAAMNGTPKTDTNWAMRSVVVFSGPAAATNSSQLNFVLTA